MVNNLVMRYAKQLLVFILLVVALKGFAAGKATRVVLMVWDGMRPDFISEQTTPNLVELSKRGVMFMHHHPVYPSMTEVNATALATGVYPWQSGLIGNIEFRPAVDPFKPFDTYSPVAIRRADELTGGHFLQYPTVAEILQDKGLRTAIAGSKPVALLLDRALRPNDALGVDVYAGNALPQELTKTLAQTLGRFPEPGTNKLKIDRWTTDALTGTLWQKNVPPFSTLWMAEPDYSQHLYGPGSKEALGAIKSSDDNLGRVTRALKEKGALDSTDIIVVSDHGFSTIAQSEDLVKILTTNGFRAWKQFQDAERKPGDILAVGLGGLIYCYVTDHKADDIARLVHFFQSQPFAGVVFSKIRLDGTFSLQDARIESPDAPDVAVAMRWNSEPSKTGTPGLIDSTGGLAPGQGQHGSLSAFDMHNICVAAGPDFVPGMQDRIASGNIDIAPTILWILGVNPPKEMAGRVLSEALVDSPSRNPSPSKRHQETEWTGDGFVWHQYLDSTEVNGVIYFDQGDGYQATH